MYLKTTSKYKIAITQGDINGIGYEIVYKTFSETLMFDYCIPIVYGNYNIADSHRKQLKIDINLNLISNISEAKEGVLNILSCVPNDFIVEFGKITSQAGMSAFLSLEKATSDLKKGYVDILVTNPINKKNIQCDKFNFNGHTEYLENRLGSNHGALMILKNNFMKVALATSHIPISCIANTLTSDLIELKLRQLQYSLCHDFLSSMPKIAVLSINPHCGDNGLIGSEEEVILVPTIQKLVSEGKHIFGPFSPDGFFGAHKYQYFDAVLAMYHDQGLIPFKTLSMDEGVNFTAGLNFVRTSPDHGTAYDIAGKGIASPLSFKSAIFQAIAIYKNRLFDNTSERI